VNLAPGSTFYWRVNAANGNGTSGWSEVWSFTTVLTAPLPPVLASPTDGTTEVSTNVTLSWGPSAGASSYRLQLSSGPSFTPSDIDDSSLTTTSLAIANLVKGTTYRWRVNAKNSAGTSGWSGVWTFATVLPPPVAVSLHMPAHNGTISADSVRLVWRKGAPAVVKYEVQCAIDSLFTFGTADTNVVDTSHVIRPLLNKAWYFWRVRSRNVTGWGPFSDVRKFQAIIIGVDVAEGTPTGVELYQNYPNPFNPSTQIEFSVPLEMRVQMDVFDVLGQKVATLVNDVRQKGRHRVQFDAGNLSNGVYLVRLMTGGTGLTRKIVLAK